jgi:hypothetical protein
MSDQELMDISASVSLFPSQPIDRHRLERQTLEEFSYPTCVTARQVLMLLAIAEAADKFVGTTSVFRQRKESREAFGDMAVALSIAKEQM